MPANAMLDELRQVLENQRAWERFVKLPPSHQREYLRWIADAKKPETRRRRMAQAAVMIQKKP